MVNSNINLINILFLSDYMFAFYKITILIPCYNESMTIKKMVSDCKKKVIPEVVIYVYDNNSTIK